MMRTHLSIAAAAAVLLAPVSAESAERIKCRLSYDLSGWAFIYQHAEGSGRITCSNGQTAGVAITVDGGGATLGRTRVVGGSGTFSSVTDISDLYGTYVEVGAHAGAGRSADARAMVKGNVSLSLAGLGEGVSVGIAIGAFRIAPR